MGRRGILITAWVGATILATVIAWAAVSQVTDEVAPSAALPLPTTAALAGATDPPDPTEDTVAAAEQTRRRRRQAQQDDPQPAPTEPGTGEDDPTVRQPAEPQPDDEPEPQAAARTVGYELTGGSVTVRYRGTRTELVQATPKSGFVVDVHDSGPQKVEVRFRSDNHESRIVARVEDGEPDVDRDERPR